NTLTIYPNPAIDKIHIDLGGFSGRVSAHLINIYGEEVLDYKQFDTKTEDLLVNNLMAGVYFLKVQCNGKEYIVKVIKL
ncbi:MAG: T9SS type A sorting domain-containing protein, partial [Bacteroidetes bacterium]|nr:T9SS type A sorting domain-containing protein [Bacteroidota bacterium]